MKLPNGSRAKVDECKILDYLLSPTHPIGRFKAKYFASLDFTSENWRAFQSAIQRAGIEGDATLVRDDEFGQKYAVSGALETPAGQFVDVVTVWMVDADSDTPRLVTVYPR